MKESLSRVFNWKKYPGAVFPMYLPLLALAVLLILAQGVLNIIQKGDWIPMIIAVVGIVMGIILLIPVYRMHKLILAAKEKAKRNEHDPV